ncbi:MAG: NUDIX domain-containing protein, partial [Anaerolineae bacterium]|nr:NUDIX domain-containing protein [Anaerolineae bacterium]
QALMDLGATVCLPKNPFCLLCPLAELCKARALGVQEGRPVMKPKAAVPHKLKAAAVLVVDGKTLLKQRPAAGLLGGLWEFPSAEVDTDSPEALAAVIETEYRLKVSPLARMDEVRHAYTHFKLTEIPWRCELIHIPEDSPLKWVEIAELSQYPMGKVDRAIAKKIESGK